MRNSLFFATSLALVASSTVALASGASPRGGAGDDWGTKVVQGTNSRISDERRLISRGRAQVRRYITCKSCEYADNLTNETAREISQAVRNGRFNIRDSQRNAVLAYLNKRYGV